MVHEYQNTLHQFGLHANPHHCDKEIWSNGSATHHFDPTMLEVLLGILSFSVTTPNFVFWNMPTTHFFYLIPISFFLNTGTVNQILLWIHIQEKRKWKFTSVMNMERPRKHYNSWKVHATLKISMRIYLFWSQLNHQYFYRDELLFCESDQYNYAICHFLKNYHRI